MTERHHVQNELADNWLEGEIVRLEPLRREHAKELLSISGDAQIRRYLTTRGGSLEQMETYVDGLLRDHLSGTALPFIVRMAADSRLAGCTRLKNISPENRNTESKRLLLEYGFEWLRCFRVEFQTDSRNVRSRNALTKMGAIERPR